jgi:hypothetical protein
LYNTKIARGNAFNDKAKKEGWYPFHEVNVIGLDGKSYRLDSYNPYTGKIVSRKATDLEEIQLSTFRSYLSELKRKYAPGAVIRSNTIDPIYDGKQLWGEQILEIPASNRNFNMIEEYKRIAKDDYNVTIVFREE